MKVLANNTQVLNVHYRQELTPDNLNKMYYQLFAHGVIHAEFFHTATTITISSLGFLIHPQNQSDLLVRIDITEPVTISTTASINTYLVARYRWENANRGAEFFLTDDANIGSTDVILVGLRIDELGNILGLDYDVQERAHLRLITTTTEYPLVSMLDGYGVGHAENNIPISDGVLNENLNAEYWADREITDVIVSKQKEDLDYFNVDEVDLAEDPITYPDWMDTDAVDLGEGATAEYVSGYKIQPQDGATRPNKVDKVPVANTLLQRDLNAERLGGYTQSKFAKDGHTHDLDEILDDPNPSDPNYYRALGIEGGLATADSIQPEEIDYRKLEWLGYDSTTGNKYQPVYETGEIILQGSIRTYQPFSRLLRNARVFLQRSPGTENLADGGEKRAARVNVMGTSGFNARQMGPIVKNGTTYEYSELEDYKMNRYVYLAIGEVI
jgi:hypothetical protein